MLSAAPESGFRVNFLIAGVQKGGTTALHRFLSFHPEISMAEDKEVHLFDDPAFDDRWTPAEVDRLYRPHFPGHRGEPLVGETTPAYSFLPRVARRIARYNPAMKVILLLRDPVERALSHYRMEFVRRVEPFPPALAFRVEPLRLRLHARDFSLSSPLRQHSYVSRGFYTRQIERLRSVLPPEQILLLRSEELARRHRETLQRVYGFLGVHDRSVTAPPDRVFAGPPGPEVPRAVRRRLARIFEPELRSLERYLPGCREAWGGSGSRGR